MKSLKSTVFNLRSCYFLLVLSLTLVLVVGPSSSYGGTAKSTGGVEVWKFVSVARTGNPNTEYAERLAAAIEKWSEGKIDIQVFPYGTLGSSTDIAELVHSGEAQFLFTDMGWMAGFVKETQIFCLKWLWPRDKYAETMEWVCRNGESIKILREAFQEKGFHLLNFNTNGWIYWTSNKKLKTLEDFDGLKIRTQGARMLLEGFKVYGAAPTPIAWGEVYSALQMGLVDAQASTLIGAYLSSFHETTKYWTKSYGEMYTNLPCVNYEFWNNLPKETKDFISNWMNSEIKPMADWVEKEIIETIEKLKVKKPELEISTLTEAEAKPFIEAYKPAYEAFNQLVPGRGKVLLSALMKDIENAKKELGIK